VILYQADFWRTKICAVRCRTGVWWLLSGTRLPLTKSAGHGKILCGGNHLDTSVAGWKNIQKYSFGKQDLRPVLVITKPVVESGKHFRSVSEWQEENGYEPVMEFTKEGQGIQKGLQRRCVARRNEEGLSEFQRIDREEFSLPGAQFLSPQAYGKTCTLQQDNVHCPVFFGGRNGDPLRRVSRH